jgi:hypothetical protein
MPMGKVYFVCFPNINIYLGVYVHVKRCHWPCHPRDANPMIIKPFFCLHPNIISIASLKHCVPPKACIYFIYILNNVVLDSGKKIKSISLNVLLYSMLCLSKWCCVHVFSMFTSVTKPLQGNTHMGQNHSLLI